MTNLKEALGLHEGERPFPWQEELLDKLASGLADRVSLDIPTGLGKTSVMAAWLVAKTRGANLPTRLVYVVQPRTCLPRSSERGLIEASVLTDNAALADGALRVHSNAASLKPSLART